MGCREGDHPGDKGEECYCHIRCSESDQPESSQRCWQPVRTSLAVGRACNSSACFRISMLDLPQNLSHDALTKTPQAVILRARKCCPKAFDLCRPPGQKLVEPTARSCPSHASLFPKHTWQKRPPPLPLRPRSSRLKRQCYSSPLKNHRPQLPRNKRVMSCLQPQNSRMARKDRGRILPLSRKRQLLLKRRSRQRRRGRRTKVQVLRTASSIALCIFGSHMLPCITSLSCRHCFLVVH